MSPFACAKTFVTILREKICYVVYETPPARPGSQAAAGSPASKGPEHQPWNWEISMIVIPVKKNSNSNSMGSLLCNRCTEMRQGAIEGPEACAGGGEVALPVGSARVAGTTLHKSQHEDLALDWPLITKKSTELRGRSHSWHDHAKLHLHSGAHPRLIRSSGTKTTNEEIIREREDSPIQTHHLSLAGS